MIIYDDVCIICYEQVGMTKYNTICDCNFYYHEECYLQWIAINSICVICMKPVTKKKVLETINPLCLNNHIPSVRDFLETDARTFSLENSNSISSENSEYTHYNNHYVLIVCVVIYIFIVSLLIALVQIYYTI